MLLNIGELYDIKRFLLASFIIPSLETRKVQFYHPGDFYFIETEQYSWKV